MRAGQRRQRWAIIGLFGQDVYIYIYTYTNTEPYRVSLGFLKSFRLFCNMWGSGVGVWLQVWFVACRGWDGGHGVWSLGWGPQNVYHPKGVPKESSTVAYASRHQDPPWEPSLPRAANSRCIGSDIDFVLRAGSAINPVNTKPGTSPRLVRV